MTDTDIERLGIGGNKPPATEVLVEQLAQRHLTFCQEITAFAYRCETVPAVLETQADDELVADLGVEGARLAKLLEEKRKGEADPHYDVWKTINGWFKAIGEPLVGINAFLAKSHGDYAKRQAEAERRRQREIAEAARKAADAKLAEAAKLEQEAIERGANASIPALIRQDIAEAHAQRADDAEERARAPMKELVHTRSASGAKATATENWTGVVEDRAKLDLEALRPYLKLDELNRAVKEFVRKGGRQLTGAKIFPDTRVGFRR